MAQEKKNLSDAGEIGRIAREQYQLVSPGQQAYEVLPPSGATAAGTPYAGDPGLGRPGHTVRDAGAPAGRRHHDDDHGAACRAAPARTAAATTPARRRHGRLRLPHAARARILALNPRGRRAAARGRRRCGGARCSAGSREASSPSWSGADGRPVVIANEPFLRDGTPMPTRYWLVDPELRALVGRLEAAGGVREAEAQVDAERWPTATAATRRSVMP